MELAKQAERGLWGAVVAFALCLLALAASPASAYAAQVSAADSLAAGTISTQSNGMINQVSDSPDDYGQICFSNQNAIPSYQVEQRYRDEAQASFDALYEQYWEDKITWEQYKAQRAALDKQLDDKIYAYQQKVERIIYDGWSFDKYIADLNRTRANEGYAALTAAQIQQIRTSNEGFELDDESYVYGMADTIRQHATQSVKGASYNLAKNTLTLKNVKTSDVLYIRDAGNNFTIKVVGTNEVGGIYVYDNENAVKWNATKKSYVSVNEKADWGAGLTLSGTGSLYVNKNKNSRHGISISSSNTAASLTVGANVSLRALSDGSDSAIFVSGTNQTSWAKAIILKGLDSTPDAKHSTYNVSYPLYKPASYDAEDNDTLEGVSALNPNYGSTGEYLLCSDNKHIAKVAQYHKDAKTRKYVVDQWQVREITLETESDGSYGYNYVGGKEWAYVADQGGSPKGYGLIRMGTQPAVNTYEIADTDFSQIGKTITVGKTTYAGKKGGNVYLKKAANAKTVKVPATVQVNGKKLAVTGISAKAFAKAKKCKTISIKTKKLTKASVKKSLKGAKKVATVKVPKASKKAYAEYFAKSNSGKKVTVK